MEQEKELGKVYWAEMSNKFFFSLCYMYVGLSLEPLIGAIGAGNVVVIKPSELAPASASVLANTVHSYLDNKAVKVIQGGPSVVDQLLQQKWDKILFTGLFVLPQNFCTSKIFILCLCLEGQSQAQG